MANRIPLPAGLALLAALGCGETQPRNACSVQLTIGNYGLGGFSARYRIQSASGAACKAILGADQPGEVTGETLGVTSYGRFGEQIGLKPASAGYAAVDGTGVAVGAFDSQPDRCVADTLAPGAYRLADPSWVAPDPLPDPAPAAPTMEITYAFADVRFVQAPNIPGTQMTATLDLRAGPAQTDGDGAGACAAKIAVDAVWYANGYARCESDDDCKSEALGLPGPDGSYVCTPFMPLMPDQVAVLDDKGEPVTDADGNPVTRAAAPKRCAVKDAVPVGAL